VAVLPAEGKKLGSDTYLDAGLTSCRCPTSTSGRVTGMNS